MGLLAIAPSRLCAKEVDGAELFNKVVKSCAYILTPVKGGHAEGSGSLIDAEKKLVVTNYHVVEEQDKVFVIFPLYIKGELLVDKNKYKDRVVNKGLGIKGTVLCRDKSRDLAIVQVESIPEGIRAIPLAKDSPKPNTPVWQIGNAGAVSQAFRVSQGDVSAVGKKKTKVGGGGEVFELNCKIITATNPTNEGDSGGPLFDSRGYQVGVTESYSPGGKLVSLFVDVTEIHALLKEKNIKIKDLANDLEPPPKKDTKLVTPPAKESAVEPPKKETAVAPPPPPPPMKETTPAPSAADEKAAADKLRNAMLFKNGDDNRPTYISKLKEIVTKWPDTAAGKEAKKLLDGLK
jgi:hypothetical protein